MLGADSEFGFENARRVPIAWPEDPEEPAETQQQYDALEVIHLGLLIVLDGHKDGALVRAAALAVLIGLFPNAAEAANSIGVDRSTVSRALDVLRNRINADFSQKNASDHAPQQIYTQPTPS